MKMSIFLALVNESFNVKLMPFFSELSELKYLMKIDDFFMNSVVSFLFGSTPQNIVLLGTAITSARTFYCS
jgi:hypothetical protein